MSPSLYLGHALSVDAQSQFAPLCLPSHRLVTHGVVVGMTGSGKTGLITVLIEEAARARVPTIVIDVEGDFPNRVLAFPSFDPGALEPWVEIEREGLTPAAIAERAVALAEQRRAALQ